MDHNVKTLVKNIAFFLEHGEKFFLDFEKRYATVYKHNKYLSELLFEFEEKHIPEVKGVLEKVREEILVEFKVIESYPFKSIEELYDSDKKITAGLQYENKFLHEELVDYMKGLNSFRSKTASDRIKGLVLEIQHEESDVRNIDDIMRYAIELFERWRYILRGVKNEVEQEKALIDRIISAINSNVEFKDLKDLLHGLRTIIKNLNLELIRERNEFLIPMNSFFKKEHSLKNRIKHMVDELEHDGMILDKTKVQEDLRKVSTSQEVVAYCADMMAFLAETELPVPDREKMIKRLKIISNNAQTNMFDNVQKKLYLQSKSSRDALTGATIRGVFFEVAPNFLANLQRDVINAHRIAKEIEIFAGIILFDIDKFKSFNDTYGHQVGDRVLRFVSTVLATGIRSGDMFVRYGGEELIVFIPYEKDPANIKMLAERLREKIERDSIKAMSMINDASNIPESQQRKNVTASAGVGIFKATNRPYTNDDFRRVRDMLIKKADVALYQAKESGRNRVVSDNTFLE